MYGGSLAQSMCCSLLRDALVPGRLHLDSLAKRWLASSLIAIGLRYREILSDFPKWSRDLIVFPEMGKNERTRVENQRDWLELS